MNGSAVELQGGRIKLADELLSALVRYFEESRFERRGVVGLAAVEVLRVVLPAVFGPGLLRKIGSILRGRDSSVVEEIFSDIVRIAESGSRAPLPAWFNLSKIDARMEKRRRSGEETFLRFKMTSAEKEEYRVKRLLRLEAEELVGLKERQELRRIGKKRRPVVRRSEVDRVLGNLMGLPPADSVWGALGAEVHAAYGVVGSVRSGDPEPRVVLSRSREEGLESFARINACDPWFAGDRAPRTAGQSEEKARVSSIACDAS